MGVMYDAAGGAIPSNATEILIPTDGIYARVGASLRQQFSHARFHTYTALGQVFAEWIDVETGCVWPPERAVSLWRAWRPRGCKGFYCAKSTRRVLESLLTAAERGSVEWFEADPTGVAHILAGDVATQYYWGGSYDISLTTPAFEGEPSPDPAPPVPQPSEEDLMQATVLPSGQIVVPARDPNGHLLVFTSVGPWPASAGQPFSVIDVTAGVGAKNNGGFFLVAD